MINKRFRKKIVDCYQRYLGDNLISIIFFGSRARGKGKKNSDYDLFIIAENLPEDYLERLGFLRKPLFDYNIEERVAIIAKTKKEIENSFPPLFLDLAVDGKIFYDRGFFKKKQAKIRQIIKEAGLKRFKRKNEFYWEWKRPPKSGWAIDWKGYHALS